MAPQLEPPVLVSPAARRRSWFIKIACMGALIVALHVPLFLTHGVLRERQGYQAQAVEEISRVWGGEQRMVGPVLALPYTFKGVVTRTKLVNGQSVSVDEPAVCSAVAYFLPESLAVDGTAEPEIRHRGIYDAVVYTTRLKFSGAFRVDLASAGVEAERVQWEKARVLVGASDLHGLRSISPLHVGDGRELPFESMETNGAIFLPLGVALNTTTAMDTVSFAFETAIQGSGTLTIAPLGKTTSMRLRSPWPDPSFVGAWLPTDRRVDATGFVAEWSVAHFSRGFPQSWTSRNVPTTEIVNKIQAAAFGVRFTRGVDGYGVVERAQKYGVLFFALVFAVFFLFEVTSSLRIHPLQYGIVGVALCLFFLGFLALSEFWSTALAYGAAAGACTAMISLYSWSFLQTGRRTLVVFGGLATTYGCLFFVLKSQDYALLAGTAALFAVLALIMFFTRRINWYALDGDPAVLSGGQPG